MTITKKTGRQYVLSAFFEMDFNEANAAQTIDAIDLPQGAQVIGGDIVVETVYNSTTNTLSIGDASSATRYANAVDLKAAARTALTLTGFKHTSATPSLRLTYAQTGSAPTTGKVRVRVDYVVLNRANESQG